MAHRSKRPAHGLFADVRWMRDAVRNIWGPPVYIAELAYETRRDHRQLCDWIGALEKLVRALVVHFALALIAGQPRWLVDAFAAALRRPRRPARPRALVFVICWPGRPATWIVRFPIPSFWPETRRPCGRSERGRDRRGVLPTARLATRYEACCRVLADPRPRARAFALRLLRLRAREAELNAPIDYYARLTPRTKRSEDLHRSRGAWTAEPTVRDLAHRIVGQLNAFLSRPWPRRSIESG